MVKILVLNGANINAKDKNNWTLLHYALSSGSVTICHFLVENGADVNACDIHGFRPLHFTNNIEIIQILLLNGANVNIRANNMWTPLLYACKNHQLEVVKLLIQNGAHVNVKDQNWQHTPLHLATYKKQKDVAAQKVQWN